MERAKALPVLPRLLSATLPELAPLGLDSGAKGYNPCCVLCYERLRAEAYVN